jgi:DNA uptake protein ComE-like DNA-binding protein
MAAMGCGQKKETPDDIREKTANATAEIKRNAQAVAQGVKEGLHRGNTIDLNKCSKDDLLTLPGISKETADRVLAARPYDDTHELVSRRLVSEAEYQKIEGKVTATQ